MSSLNASTLRSTVVAAGAEPDARKAAKLFTSDDALAALSKAGEILGYRLLNLDTPTENELELARACVDFHRAHMNACWRVVSACNAE